MRTDRSKLSRLLSWGLFLGALFTVGTGFNPGTLTRSGCEDVIEDANRMGLVTVRVEDARTGAVIAGASVMLEGLSGTTGDTGEARFTGLVTGTTTLEVSHAGYVTKSVSVVLTNDQEDGQQSLTVALTPVDDANAHPLPLWDTTVFVSDPLTMTHRDDPLLVFESSTATLAHQASAVAYIEPDLSKIPAGAMLQSVTLFGQQILDCCSSPPDGGGDNGGGDGGGDAPSRDHLSPRATADEDIPLEAYGVLQPWNQDDINYLNQPVDYTESPVATATIHATAPDNAGLRPFEMDLTQFVTRVRSGVLRAHGFVLTTRDIIGTGGVAQAAGVTSSEYAPAEGALRIVAVYTTAAGRTEQVELR